MGVMQLWLHEVRRESLDSVCTEEKRGRSIGEEGGGVEGGASHILHSQFTHPSAFPFSAQRFKICTDQVINVRNVAARKDPDIQTLPTWRRPASSGPPPPTDRTPPS